MTPSAALTKEVRALLPACAAIVAALVFSSGAPDALRVWLVMLVLAFGSITLGGLAFGHEYSYRTLTLLLAQPIDRRRTCAAKLAALLSMVALVWLAAVLSAPGRPLQMFNGARGEVRGMLIIAPSAPSPGSGAFDAVPQRTGRRRLHDRSSRTRCC